MKNIILLLLSAVFFQQSPALAASQNIKGKLKQLGSYTDIYNTVNKYLNDADKKWLKDRVSKEQLSKVVFKPKLRRHSSKLALEWAKNQFVFIEFIDIKKQHIKINGTLTDFKKISFEQLVSKFEKASGNWSFFEILTPKAHANPIFAVIAKETVPILAALATAGTVGVTLSEYQSKVVSENHEFCKTKEKRVSELSGNLKEANKILAEVRDYRSEFLASGTFKFVDFHNHSCKKGLKDSKSCKLINEFDKCVKNIVKTVSNIQNSVASTNNIEKSVGAR